MLLEMSIENLALIESARLSFGSGLTVFTGETGAGKSILLDAIGLLLGSRASSDLIRHGQQKAFVEGLFAITPNLNEAVVRARCADYGVELPPDEFDLLVSREVHANGRTVCRVNGRITTVQMLREVGLLLVGQHGQHEHQGLIEAKEQLRFLDLYGRHSQLLDRVCASYEEWSAAEDAFRTAKQNEQERIRRLDMLTFQVDEIGSAHLIPGEEQELQVVRHRLQYAEKISDALRLAVEALDGGNTGAGAATLLASANREVAAALAHDEQLRAVCDLLDTAQVHADEALRTLYRHLQQIETDPIRLDSVEERLAQIRTLERKYGPTVEDVLAHYQACVVERDETVDYEAHLSRLQQAAAKAWAKLADNSQALHEARVEAAKRLAHEVEEVLRTLTLPNAQLHIEVKSRETDDGFPRFGSNGFDDVTFLFSANKGEPVRPLSRIASGGELSRTLLALKTALSAVDDVETMVFDEIDVGVSGAAAQQIALCLQQLGRTRQVLCVTHSPQVAAAGDLHYCIEKTESTDNTITAVRALSKGGRVDEIARLVGGHVSGETANVHAKALLDGFHPGH